jgi:hypothetical protein
MDDQPDPSNSLLRVPLRSNSILMSRVRGAQYQDLRARLDSRALEGLFFIHLKQDLPVESVNWRRCQDPIATSTEQDTITPYGIEADLQRRLAGVRTDLDSFTEVEAYSLMLSGYLMAAHQLERLQGRHEAAGEPGTWGGFDLGAPKGNWRFRELEALLGQPRTSDDPRRRDLDRQLEVAASPFFKIWRLDPRLRRLRWPLFGLVALAAAFLIAVNWSKTVSLGAVMIMLAVVGAGIVFPIVKWLSPQRVGRSLAVKAAVAVLGYIVSHLNLLVFDRWFLRRGRLQALLDKMR